ncbi:sugar phosphate isomerase/epimerase family protein [Novosphingobium malaysiense]|uniref:sugar phosphate isomerase/epimerase family protein n=1 Tax=Novosphingobium malaysiense TaxID=1348853 RepID=UPI00068C47A5|nr:sugar phosphate isomerase/epimerase family protein [Novosphingobium malaysiense]
MHSRVSINTLSLAPAPLPDLVRTVAGIGARGISPDLEQLADYGIASSQRLLRDCGLAVATLTHRDFAFSTAEEAAKGRKRLLATIDIASECGAQSIIMTTGGRGALAWPAAGSRFVETVQPCVEAARAAGIELGIEPTSHLYADASIVHRLSDATALARSAGISVMMDLFPCWCDADIEAAIAQAVPLAPLVQVSDYVYGDRALPCRAVPGDGVMGWDGLIPKIVHAGFTGWFDLEIIGPRLQAEGQEQGLRRAAQVVGALLEEAGMRGEETKA